MLLFYINYPGAINMNYFRGAPLQKVVNAKRNNVWTINKHQWHVRFITSRSTGSSRSFAHTEKPLLLIFQFAYFKQLGTKNGFYERNYFLSRINTGMVMSSSFLRKAQHPFAFEILNVRKVTNNLYLYFHI